jgi:hypothetical protein
MPILLVNRHRRPLRFPALLALAVLVLTALAGIAAAAKPPEIFGTGTLDGRLTDWQSVPLAQAVVVVRNLSTGAVVRGVTGKNGSYHFTGLGPGEYRLEADVPQLGKGAVEGILVSAGHATRVQAALVMTLPVQDLPIEADLRGIDPITPAVTTMIASEELSTVPVSSRNWQAFAATTPASAPAGRGADGGQFETDALEATGEQSLSMGGAGSQTASSIDGMTTTPAFRTNEQRQSRGNGSLGASAVQEMQARTGNASADAGSGAGGSIDLVTGHGRNGLHGQAFYLNRESLWGALDPFTQWVRQTAPATGIYTAQFTPEPYSPANGQQTIGLGLGSQIKRDKLFWFAAVDGLLRSDPAVATVRHPDDFFSRPTDDELTVLAARLGSTALQTCAAGALPQAAVLEQAVACYSAWLGQIAGVLGPVPRRSSQWQDFARLDWEMTERQHLNIEGEAAKEQAPSGALSATSETYGSHSFGNSQATDAWGLVKWDSFLTANLLNAAAVQFQRHLQGDTPQKPSAFEAPLTANGSGQLPEIITDSKYGFILGKPAHLGGSRYPDEHFFAAQDILSWVRGAHLLKAGVSFDHASDAVNSQINQSGTYSYTDVLNFISDTASFDQFGIKDVGNPFAGESNCDATGRVSVRNGVVTGLGPLPCYAWYSQTIGPSNWQLSTNDLAAFATEQWQPFHNLTLSAGLRLEAEQLPPPIAKVANPELQATQKLPAAMVNWGPRFGLAWAPGYETVLRAGAGLYYGRIDNSVVLAALTQTGSLNGDLDYFFKPTDADAPPFPTVFPVPPQTVVTPGAVAFAPNFHLPEVDQGVVSLEHKLPSHWMVSVSALASLGRRLPISIDTNLVRAMDANGNPQTITYDVTDVLKGGPIKTPSVTVPLFTERADTRYQQITSIESRANSTYQAAMIKLARYGGHGLSLHAHYLYAHATDWNPNESGQVAGNDILDPQDFRLEYGTSNLDIRHTAGATILYQDPWKLRDWAGVLANGWGIAVVGQFRSGLPYTMRTSGYIPAYYDSGRLVEGVAPGLNGSGGDNRLYNVGRNTYRYPATWTGDTRLAKSFNLAHERELELLAESFNLFNHQNVTLIETTGYYVDRGSLSGSPATLNFMTGLGPTGLPNGTVEFGQPLNVNATNFYRPREIQLGVKARF